MFLRYIVRTVTTLQNSSDWLYHRGFSAVGAGSAEWLDRPSYLALFGEPRNIEEEVRASQFAQAEGLRYANQEHR